MLRDTTIVDTSSRRRRNAQQKGLGEKGSLQAKSPCGAEYYERLYHVLDEDVERDLAAEASLRRAEKRRVPTLYASITELQVDFGAARRVYWNRAAPLGT